MPIVSRHADAVRVPAEIDDEGEIVTSILFGTRLRSETPLACELRGVPTADPSQDKF
jgi:hypothetical protein